MVAGKPVVSPTLVGRGDELAALTSVVCDVPAVVCIEGEAGVGKSRLVSELLSRAELAEHEVLIGRCHQIRESFPLGPVVEAVRALGDGLARLSLTPVVGALRPLLPELASVLPAQPDPLDDPVGERHRVFRGLVEVLAGLGPAVLVLEDLHWADEQTIDFVSYLLADLPPELAVVLSYRGEEVSAAVRALTAKLPAGTSRAHLVLSPLGQHGTGQLAAAIFGAESVSAEFASYLHERTSGLPFVIEEVLALARPRGLVVQTSAGWARRSLEDFEVPRGVRDSTLARLARLPAAAQRLAEAMAVLQTPTEPPVLLAMTGSTDAAGVDSDAMALDEAIGSGLLVEEGNTLGFRHLLAAQAVYENLSGARRQELHGRAAVVLESLPPVRLGQVAYHLKHAGQLVEWAVKAEAAADQAAALGHDTEAARLLEDVLRHAPLEADQHGRLAVKLGRAAIQTLDPHHAVDLLWQALDQNPPPVVRGELRLMLAMALNQHGDELKRQRQLWEDAIADLGERPDLQVVAMSSLGYLLDQDVPLAVDLEWMRRSVDVAQQAGDPLLEAFIVGKAAGALIEAGDRGWRELADRVQVLTGGAPRRRREVYACYSIGAAACYLGHLATAEVFLGAGLGAPGLRDNRRLEIVLRSGAAALAYFQGRWQGLGEEVGGLLAELADYPYSGIDVEIVAGCLDLAHADVDGALQRLGDAVEMCGRLGALVELQCAGDALVRALLSRGEAEDAVAVVRRCLAPLAAKGLWAPFARLLPAAAEAFAAAGEEPQAAELAERAARELRGLDAPLAPAALRYAQGVLAGSAGEFLAAAELYQAVPAPYEAARARERAAGLLFGTGAAAAAEAELRRALAVYDEQGASWDHARAAGLARQHGIAPARRHGGGRQSYGMRLSPQEEAVAELAARGRSNKQIATQLFISHRTVERHLSSVMRKVGVRSRAELAFWLASAQSKDE